MQLDEYIGKEITIIAQYDGTKEGSRLVLRDIVLFNAIENIKFDQYDSHKGSLSRLVVPSKDKNYLGDKIRLLLDKNNNSQIIKYDYLVLTGTIGKFGFFKKETEIKDIKQINIIREYKNKQGIRPVYTLNANFDSKLVSELDEAVYLYGIPTEVFEMQEMKTYLNFNEALADIVVI